MMHAPIGRSAADRRAQLLKSFANPA